MQSQRLWPSGNVLICRLLILKGGNIQSLTDARFFASWGADWISLNLDPETGIDTGLAGEIVSWLSGPQIAGEWQNPGNISPEAVADLGLNGVQWPLGSGPGLELPGITIFRESTLPEAESIGPKARFDYLVLKTDTPPDQWNKEAVKSIMKLTVKYEVVLQAPVQPQALPRVAEFGFTGLNLDAIPEEQTGLKAFDDLNELLEKWQELYG